MPDPPQASGHDICKSTLTLREMIPDVDAWDISITATDISDMAIRQASIGHYRDHEIQRGMKPALLNKYFTREPNGWKIKDELRGMVALRRLNLFEIPAAMGPFDVILCRNVAIYFSRKDRSSLFARLTEMLVEDGYLFVGSSESLTDLGYAPQQHCRAIYYRPKLTVTCCQ